MKQRIAFSESTDKPNKTNKESLSYSNANEKDSSGRTIDSMDEKILSIYKTLHEIKCQTKKISELSETVKDVRRSMLLLLIFTVLLFIGSILASLIP